MKTIELRFDQIKESPSNNQKIDIGLNSKMFIFGPTLVAGEIYGLDLLFITLICLN
jgi:hypothetical protein